MPFFQSDYPFVANGDDFKSVDDLGPTTLNVVVHPKSPSDSQIPSDGNQSNALVSRFLDMTGNVGPPADNRLSTEAASPPVSEEKPGVRYVHPGGWTYFFKEHDDEPNGIRLHEIYGDETPSHGGRHVQIYVDDRRWYASIDKDLLLSQQLTDEQGQNYLV